MLSEEVEPLPVRVFAPPPKLEPLRVFALPEPMRPAESTPLPLMPRFISVAPLPEPTPEAAPLELPDTPLLRVPSGFAAPDVGVVLAPGVLARVLPLTPRVVASAPIGLTPTPVPVPTPVPKSAPFVVPDGGAEAPGGDDVPGLVVSKGGGDVGSSPAPPTLPGPALPELGAALSKPRTGTWSPARDIPSWRMVSASSWPEASSCRAC